MRKMVMFPLVASCAAVGIAFAAYLATRPSDDPLGDELRAFHFLPVQPPSTLLSVGALYYVDAAVKEFRTICRADESDLSGFVVQSRSLTVEDDSANRGGFATNITVNLGSLLHGSAQERYNQRVHVSLTNVVLEEIPLGQNWRIFSKLMKQPQCSDFAKQVLQNGGYVCEGQEILQATAEFKLSRDVLQRLGSDTNTGEVNADVKLAIETQSAQSVVERDGRLFAGQALDYGIAMNPYCLAPPRARFARVLPETAFGRLANFVLFRIVEPLLPSSSDVEEATQTADKTENN